jgi:hypothetical protein
MTTLDVHPAGIPAELKALPQWVLWRNEERDGKSTKVPYTPDGLRRAESDNAATWGTFDSVIGRYTAGGFSGVGFVFTLEAGIVGIDLDGCRNPETGDVDGWAMPTLSFDSYCEISPSGTGLKMFLLGALPTDKTGAKTKEHNAPAGNGYGGKKPGIEAYQRGRFFAVTGHGLPDFTNRLTAYNGELADWFHATFTPKPTMPTVTPAPSPLTFTVGAAVDDRQHLIERAKAYLRKMPAAVSGARGHDRAFHAACVLRCDFGLPFDDAWAAIRDWNSTCSPPWNEAELRHKLENAGEQPVTLRLRNGQQPAAVLNSGNPLFTQTQTALPQVDPVTFPLMTFAELDSTTDEIEYLIDPILVAGQPGGIFGGKKSLKTNVAIDLAESLATGGKFLNEFQVTRAVRVAILSGESGQPTIRETARRIAKSKGTTLASIAGAQIGYRMPNLSSVEHLMALEKMVVDSAIEVLIIDPTYLCLPIGDGAANLFIVGGLLLGLSQIVQRTNCTILLIHHTKKNPADKFAPPELESIAWSGFQEWIRQWVLIGRREEYDPEQGGSHKLWLNVGGSAGHSGLWGVDIEEGTRQDTGGRHWEVTVAKASEVRTEARQTIDEGKAKMKAEKRAQTLEASRERIRDALRRRPAGETESQVRDLAGLNSREFAPALQALLEADEIERCEIKKSKKTYGGIRLKKVSRDKSGQVGTKSLVPTKDDESGQDSL